MTVEVDGDRAIPLLFLYINERFPLLKKERGKGLPEVVEPNPTQARGLRRAWKNPVAQVISIEEVLVSLQKIYSGMAGQPFEMAWS